MHPTFSVRPRPRLLLAAGLLAAGPALANIDLPGGDIWFDGSFQGMTYGSAGAANLAPRLYIGEFASTVPPQTQIVGTGLEFEYEFTPFGAPVVNVTYRFINNDFDAWHDLRFILDLHAKGQPGELDTATVTGFGVPATAGQADQYQVFDFDAPGDNPLQLIEAANALNGTTAPACGVGCFPDMAMQWNLAELPVGATWEINATLVDDPSLVIGGRYLTASTLGSDGSQILIGNVQLVPEPETYAMMLAGLGLLGWRKLRKK